MKKPEWISVKDKLPEKDGSYLCVLKSGARSNHCKTWAGMGEPEIVYFCNDWHFKWNARGTLLVVYWMPLPKFDMVWQKNEEGKEGEWK
jgi:hypothetical protein